MTDLEVIRDMIKRAIARGDMRDMRGAGVCQAKIIEHNAHGNWIEIDAGLEGYIASFEFNGDGSLKSISAWTE